jgi:hypothetical protein
VDVLTARKAATSFNYYDKNVMRHICRLAIAATKRGAIKIRIDHQLSFRVLRYFDAVGCEIIDKYDENKRDSYYEITLPADGIKGLISGLSGGGK